MCVCVGLECLVKLGKVGYDEACRLVLVSRAKITRTSYMNLKQSLQGVAPQGSHSYSALKSLGHGGLKLQCRSNLSGAFSTLDQAISRGHWLLWSLLWRCFVPLQQKPFIFSLPGLFLR